jgi:tetratricopeptide (TPR) repeat protein
MRPGQDDEGELVRWRQTSMDPSALPARAADLADAARDVAPLAPEALARIKADVVARRPSRAAGLPMGLRVAVLAAIVLASVATARGTMRLWRRFVAVPEPVTITVPPRQHVAKPKVALHPRVEPVEPVVEAPPVAPDPHPALSPAGRGEEKSARPAVRRSKVEEPDATSEAQLLADALSRLRQTHDPRGALAVLDRYAKAYPRGVLASEALSARLEAVLALDDRKAALKLLDERTAFAGRLGAEQLLTRAELRASAGRYADALADFDRLLAPGTPTPDAERALYGRAVTLGHLGRNDRARADLSAYQQRFPTGKHAAEVARLLRL